jgi:hypothetical protein
VAIGAQIEKKVGGRWGIMTNRLTKFNAETGEYEYRERAKTQAEFIAQRKAVIQRLGEFEDKASDVVDEFIKLMIDNFGVNPYDRMNFDVRDLVELKNKYESEKDE